jgi:hypothetical protein
MDKNKILANVDNLTAGQLFSFIESGIVNLDEIVRTGNLGLDKRRSILALIANLEEKDQATWNTACNGNENDLNDYISRFPAGKYIREAKEKIRNFENIRSQALGNKHKVLQDIRNNLNFYDPDQIKGFLVNGTITESDLFSLGVPQNVIRSVYNVITPPLKLEKTPNTIPDGFTEVYFWGIMGSGKTCALAAILSTLNSSGLIEIPQSSGFDYTNRLITIFNNDLAYLPTTTNFRNTQYLPFTIREANERNARSVSLIELSGEIFNCFYTKVAGLPFKSNDHETTFNAVETFLRTKNPKIHFFFVDYENGNKTDIDGLTQLNYLQAATTYFANPNNKIFDKTTQAIYIVLTKSDMLNGEKENRREEAKKYLTSERLISFVNVLKEKCVRFGINGGNLEFIPFSLGKVFFQQICEFDKETSKDVIRKLMEKIRAERNTIFDLFNK